MLNGSLQDVSWEDEAEQGLPRRVDLVEGEHHRLVIDDLVTGDQLVSLPADDLERGVDDGLVGEDEILGGHRCAIGPGRLGRMLYLTQNVSRQASAMVVVGAAVVVASGVVVVRTGAAVVVDSASPVQATATMTEKTSKTARIETVLLAVRARIPVARFRCAPVRGHDPGSPRDDSSSRR